MRTVGLSLGPHSKKEWVGQSQNQLGVKGGGGGGTVSSPSGFLGRTPKIFEKHAFFFKTVCTIETVQALKTDRDASLFAIAQKCIILL